MNRDFKYLDCTLRDGGYYTDWDFSEDLVNAYLRHVDALPIDYVELGYRSPRKEGYLGKYFYIPKRDVESAKENCANTKLAIMLNGKDCFGKEVEPLVGDLQGLLDMVRIATPAKNFAECVELAKKLKALGFEVACNVMYASKLKNDDPLFMQIAEKSASDCIDYLYLVDSYGSIDTTCTRELFQTAKSKTSLPLGFHGHNNIEMALANSLEALQAGAKIVDGTVLGMGRGAGNLKTELFLAYMQHHLNLDFNPASMTELCELFEPLKAKFQWGTNMAYMISGIYSAPQKEVMEMIQKRRYSISDISKYLFVDLNTSDSDSTFLPESDVTDHLGNCKTSFIFGGGETIGDHRAAIQRMLQSAKKPLIIHASSKHLDHTLFDEATHVFVLAGAEGRKIEKRLSKLKEIPKNLHGVVPGKPRKFGTFIPSQLNGRTFELSKRIDSESPLAIAMEFAEVAKMKRLSLVGFDGYNVSSPEDHLLQIENQQILDTWHAHLQLCAMTPTNYSGIKQGSVYNFEDLA